jgi:branched-chain amino acid transport system substrate-binding protein
MLVTTHGFPLPESPLEAYYDRYEEGTGIRPDTVFFAIGYDEIYAVKQAIEAAGSADPAAIMAALENITDFEGVTGTWSMDPETHLAQKPVTLIGIENGEFFFIDSYYPEFIPPP